MYSSLLIACES